MFCSNCGNQVPENTAACPYCRYQIRRVTPVQTPAPKTALPGFALGFGIAAVVLGVIGYAVGAVYRNVISALPLVLAFLLGIGAVIFGASGLRRSIHTGGRKYVAGIVLSAIGIASGALAHVYVFLGLLVKSLIYRF